MSASRSLVGRVLVWGFDNTRRGTIVHVAYDSGVDELRGFHLLVELYDGELADVDAVGDNARFLDPPQGLGAVHGHAAG